MPDSVYGHGDDWTGPTLLEVVSAPPPERIVAPGGYLVTVRTPLGASPAQSHPGVILAWAQTSGGDWDALLVWEGWRKTTVPLRQRDEPSARWAWVRFVPKQVGRLKPWLPDQQPGLRWFGRPSGGDVEKAYLEAAESLPEGMREASLTYTPELGPAWP